MRSNPVVAIAAAALLASLAAGCASTATVSTDYQPGTDFSRYKTFAFAGGTPAPNPFAEERIRQAIAAQLTAKGLQQTEGADLQVHSHARVQMEREVEVWDTGGWGYRRWGGSTHVDVRDVPVGTLVVDLVDRAKGELVWRGVAQGTVDPKATPEKAEQRINQAMAKLFAEFPPAK